MPSEGVFMVREGELIEMENAPYPAEADLQQLLAEHPGLLSGRQINSASPRKWLLIMREKGVPATAEGTDQWSADHLFVDQDGVPTIVEVKRSTNTQIRREVVGQMLDYAANGVRYWPVERLRSDLATRVGSPEAADTAVVEFLAEADAAGISPDEFWRQVDANLRAGKLRLLFVADAIPATLQRIIEFLNEQMTQCEVLGIEIRQYVAEGHRVFAPTVIGQTSESRRLKGQGDTRTFEELLAAASDAVRWVESRLRDLTPVHHWEVTTSKAGRQFRLPSDATLVWLAPGDEGGSLQFSFGPMYDWGANDPAFTDRVERLRTQLERLTGKPMSKRQPWTKIDALYPQWPDFENHWLPSYVQAHREMSAPSVE